MNNRQELAKRNFIRIKILKKNWYLKKLRCVKKLICLKMKKKLRSLKKITKRQTVTKTGNLVAGYFLSSQSSVFVGPYTWLFRGETKDKIIKNSNNNSQQKMTAYLSGKNSLALKTIKTIRVKKLRMVLLFQVAHNYVWLRNFPRENAFNQNHS